MSKSLYEEAVADAQKLRELAEETAKNRVVDAVMPQIRDMVNRRILGEQLEMEDYSDDVVGDEDVEVSSEEISTEVIPEPDPLSMSDVQISASEEVEESPSVVVNAQGDVNIEVEESEDDEAEMVLTDTMAEALGRLLRGESTESQRLTSIEETVTKIKKLLESTSEENLTSNQKHQLNNAFSYCLREAINLHGTLILNEQSTQEKLEQRLAETIKEMKNMSKSHRRNIFDFLFEGDEEEKAVELEEAELSLELGDDEVEDLAAAEDADAVDAALEDILAGLELEVGVGEELEGEAEDTEEVEEVEVGEEEVEVGEEEVMEGSHGMEETYEIDESMLRRELRKMRRLREQEEGAAAEADPALNHGGEDLGDVVMDVSEDDLLNALADELGPVAETEVTVESRRARRRSAGRIQESRRVKQYRNALAGMKKQLVEMNLFNAKLLYANKLMQNKNLTVKQQRAIVEALDNAKTLREAKLLYKSLSESLTRRARGKKLNEGALRTLGSSSRSTRSAQPSSSGVEKDRWAVLAGIPGND